MVGNQIDDRKMALSTERILVFGKRVSIYMYDISHMTEIYVGFEGFRLKYPSGRQILGLVFPMHSF